MNPTVQLLGVIWERTVDAIKMNVANILLLCVVLAGATFLEAVGAHLFSVAVVFIALGKAVGFSLVSLLLARSIVGEYVKAKVIDQRSLKALSAVQAFIVPLVLFSILFVSYEAGTWGILVTFVLAMLPLLEVHFSAADQTEDFPVTLFSFLRREGFLFAGVQMAVTFGFFLAFLVVALLLSLVLSERLAPLISIAILGPVISGWLLFRMELFLELQFRSETSVANNEFETERPSREPLDDDDHGDDTSVDEEPAIDDDADSSDETAETDDVTQDEESPPPRRRR